MKAQELRIGNYAAKRLKSGSGRTLEAPLGVQDIVRIKENTGSFIYEPIALTEEWLLRAKIQSDEGAYNLPLCDYWLEKGDENFWLYDVNLDGDRPHLITSIKYVHQLQNIYFDLTEEELTFA